MLTPTQLEQRRQFWTATDSAKALTGQWGGLYGVIASKLYGMEQGPTEATDIGNALENSIIDWAANKLRQAARERQVVLTEGIFSCTLDALCAPSCDIIEATAPGWASDWTDTDEWGEDGTDQVSQYKLIQVQQQMHLSGLNQAYVAAWIRGRGKLLYVVPRDNGLIDSILTYGKWAWETYVLPGKLPEPTEETSALAVRVMQQIERVPAKQIEPTPALANAVDFYNKARSARLALEKVEEHTKAMILHYMGDASECQISEKELLVISESEIEADVCACGNTIRSPFKRTSVTIKKGKKRGNIYTFGQETSGPTISSGLLE